jgi:hypothetical protein
MTTTKVIRFNWPKYLSAAAMAAAPAPTAAAQLGDSIASGEGTLYGYTYDARTGRRGDPATPDPAWSGQYPLCHDSPDAYGNIVAEDLGGTAPLSQFACTGASYLHGITGPKPTWPRTGPQSRTGRLSSGRPAAPTTRRSPRPSQRGTRHLRRR